MNTRHTHHRPSPKGGFVVGASVLLGLAASVGLLMWGDGPDLQALVKVAADSGCDIRIGSASTAL